MPDITIIKQEKFLRYIRDVYGTEQWLPVYESTDELVMFCGVMEPAYTPKSLQEPGWDLCFGDGGPGFVCHYENGKEICKYETNSSLRNTEPLIISREFHGIRPDYKEVCEEFRLFHNLYFDKDQNKHFAILDNGNLDEVIRIEPNNIKIKRKYLLEYIAAKQKNLGLYFERRLYFPESIESFSEQYRQGTVCYDLYGQDMDFFNKAHKAFSRTIGKKIILAPPIEESGIWPYRNRKVEHESFIIGFNEKGESLSYTCNHDLLANYFGANPEAPHYLTPVFFKKEVLGKYYNNPNLYSVEDSYIRCGGLWGIKIDNNHDKYVIVFLGDLGRDLPDQDEQKYWRSYNIPPDGKMSDVYFKRSIMGEFADPTHPELRFKYKFEQFQEAWEEKKGWKLFLPLRDDDRHYFTGLHVPIDDNQKEFDDQVLAISKIIIDSINQSALLKEIGFSPEYLNLSDDQKSKLTSIGKLELYLKVQKVTRVEKYIALLRNIQDLRSSAAAHRKGTKFDKVAANIKLEENGLEDSYRNMLNELVKFLDILQAQ